MTETHSGDSANDIGSMLLPFIHDDTSVPERLAFAQSASRDTEERKERKERLAADLQRLGSILGNKASAGSKGSRL